MHRGFGTLKYAYYFKTTSHHAQSHAFDQNDAVYHQQTLSNTHTHTTTTTLAQVNACICTYWNILCTQHSERSSVRVAPSLCLGAIRNTTRCLCCCGFPPRRQTHDIYATLTCSMQTIYLSPNLLNYVNMHDTQPRTRSTEPAAQRDDTTASNAMTQPPPCEWNTEAAIAAEASTATTTTSANT